MKQVIVSISREYGSGGHYIAESLSKRLNIALYDRNMLDKIGEEKGFNMEELKKYDESKKKLFSYKTVRGMSNSPEDALAMMQFDYITKKANEGESMIIVGRCADHVLRGKKELVTIFVMGDMAEKRKRIMRVRKMSEYEAEKAIQRHDRNRKAYHNSYSETKWGDSRYYECCINSSKLGLDATCDLLESYIRKRIEKM